MVNYAEKAGEPHALDASLTFLTAVGLIAERRTSRETPGVAPDPLLDILIGTARQYRDRERARQNAAAAARVRPTEPEALLHTLALPITVRDRMLALKQLTQSHEACAPVVAFERFDQPKDMDDCTLVYEGNGK